MKDDKPGSRTTLMPLSAAHDALANLASQFYNAMLVEGIKELEPDKWLDLYRSWLGSASLAREYAEDDGECEENAD